MREIVLVNPPYEHAPLLGLVHLAAMVREHGYRTSSLESDGEGLDEEAVIERVVASAPCDRAHPRLHHYVPLTVRHPTHRARLLRLALGCAHAERRSVAAGPPSLLVPRAESPN